MKKRLLYLIIGVTSMMLVACKTEKNDSDSKDNKTTIESEEKVGMTNPWTVSDKEGVLEATGFPIDAPDGATNVVYSYMKEGKLAEVTYDYNGVHWTYRMQSADELKDISGMFYEWNSEEDGTISNREAKFYAYAEGQSEDGTIDNMFCVHVVNWYDRVPGVTYSLSASGEGLNGMDIQVIAEGIFKPLQGED